MRSKHSFLTGILKMKYLMFFPLILFCCILGSWNIDTEVSNRNKISLPKKIFLASEKSPTSTIVVENCYFTKEQLKLLLIDDVRKIMLQFVNDDSSKTILVAYGTDKNNKMLSGPYYSVVVPGSTGVSVPNGGILGNLIIRRGQLKQLFDHREGKHERIDETKINNIVLIPQTNLTNQHVWYKMNTFTDFVNILTKKLFLDDLPVNPSPPAKPCEDCENYLNQN